MSQTSAVGMERFTRRTLKACTRKSRELRRAYEYGVIALRSLVYNSAVGEDYVLELLFQPVYCLVDAVVPWFGKALVVTVALLTLSVVLSMYGIVYPSVLARASPWGAALHLGYGHWNLALISFHYYKAVSTDPGQPTQGSYDRVEASVCKKCLRYRPPRAHHCRVCCRCVLKMDHHCYWMDNCVGHFNHRYFLSFCVSMTLGCVYCSATTWDLVTLGGDPVPASQADASDLPDAAALPRLDPFRRNFLVYVWVMCSGVSVILGALTLWHARLVTRGETSVERRLNERTRAHANARGQVRACTGTRTITAHLETGSVFWESGTKGTGPRESCCRPRTFPRATERCGTRDVSARNPFLLSIRSLQRQRPRNKRQLFNPERSPICQHQAGNATALA
ncbi:unnamed protein product [Lampetra fluviatilis]